MKKISQRKHEKGITLIALVVTIIVLLILAGVAVGVTLGNNGIFKRAKQGTEKYNKEEAKEQMNLKISSIQIESYGENEKLPDLQYLADKLCEDEEMEYVLLESKKEASLDKIDLKGKTSIFTKIKRYPYEFEINSSLQLASIDGIKISSSDTVTIPKEEYEELKRGYINLLSRIEAIENANYVTKSELDGSKAGEEYLTNLGEVSIENDQTGTITSISLPAGNYILFGKINVTCKYNRWCYLEGVTYSTESHGYADGSRNMSLSISGYLKTDEPKTIYLKAGQNSGGKANIKGNICAIKLSDV